MRTTMPMKIAKDSGTVIPAATQPRTLSRWIQRLSTACCSMDLLTPDPPRDRSPYLAHDIVLAEVCVGWPEVSMTVRAVPRLIRRT